MTGEKIFTPRRVPQGCSDAAIYFQKTMESSFASLLYKHLLVWIDNLLLYADGIDIYLDKLAELFSLLNDFSLKLMRTVCVMILPEFILTVRCRTRLRQGSSNNRMCDQLDAREHR
ncbi:hypothetical protein PC129_g13854 [Phytophthora cactorum]|uniref:Reverse transcriptase domain-containing protein n=1 Tax=Phytophthora cactorum TaxID=29920 RepID=A0A8T1LPZ3_9STRA|nr:hypothetical protein Pcac1_g6474 [Phytophthora cactorum]KAG2840168.1 hypothetical protein PC112_g3824 [Phytophthora cactorum]KAG2846644.1 hypothetical protein PC111_g1095 [Phytophthora cactorum]KAG2851828.1 hypothetical protein PC113_g15558 [Phytophthora cactorum]KAG2890974.1 hypothetical protein PC114_g17179 [Phytophthora cactorum]